VEAASKFVGAVFSRDLLLVVDNLRPQSSLADGIIAFNTPTNRNATRSQRSIAPAGVPILCPGPRIRAPGFQFQPMRGSVQ
jgi:hypothetical protein